MDILLASMGFGFGAGHTAGEQVLQSSSNRNMKTHDEEVTRRKKRDLPYYMKRVLAEKASSEGEQKKERAAQKCDQDARNTCDGVIEKAMENSTFQDLVTHPVTGVRDPYEIDQLSRGVYICRIFLRPFTEVHSLESVRQNNGTCQLRLCSHLGRVEKMRVISEWKEYFDGDTFSSKKLKRKIKNGLSVAVRQIQVSERDSDRDSDRTHLRIDSGSTSCLKVSAIGEDEGEEDQLLYTVEFTASVRGYGWPRWERLQHAFPLLRPYSDQGKETLQELREIISTGRSLYSYSLTTGSSPVDGWVVDHTIILAHLLSTTGIDEPLTDALAVVHTILNYCQCSNSLPTHALNHMVLWECKKAVAKQRSSPGHLLASLLKRLSDSLAGGSAQSFLNPSHNILGEGDRERMNEDGQALHAMLEAVLGDPVTLLDYTGIPRRGRERIRVEEEQKEKSEEEDEKQEEAEVEEKQEENREEIQGTREKEDEPKTKEENLESRPRDQKAQQEAQESSKERKERRKESELRRRERKSARQQPTE